MIKRKMLLLMAMLVTGTAFGQDSLLVNQFKSLFSEKNDRLKDSIADALTPKFVELLKAKSPANFNFKDIANLGVIESPDGAFRIYCYNIIYRDGSCRHFGYIQREKDGKLEVTPLADRRDIIKNPNFDRLTPDTWYGALYYQIVPFKSDGTTYYVLLGNSYNNLFTTRKVADVLQFRTSGIRFGAPLFFDGRRKACRVIFEYSARVSMTLKYFPDIKYIVFDHLVNTEGNGTDLQFFGPDGSQDGFKLEDGVWVLKQTIDFRMPKEQKKRKDFKVSNY